MSAIRMSVPLCCALLSAPMAVGQAGSGVGTAPESDAALMELGEIESAADRWSLSFGARGTYAFETDTDEGEADVSVWRAGSRLTADYQATPAFRIGVGIGSETSGYEFSGFGSLIAGADDDPFDVFNDHRISLSMLYRFEDKWLLFATPGVGAAYEVGADFGDSLTVGGVVGFGYQFTSDFRLGGGVVIQSQIEDEPRILPIISFDWRISDSWRLTNDDRLRFLNEQLGVNLIYTHDDTFSALIGVGYETRRFRLAEDSSVAGDGVLDDDRLTLGVGATWALDGGVSVRVGAGAVLYQEFDVESSSGRDIESFETDPTAFVGLRVNVDF